MQFHKSILSDVSKNLGSKFWGSWNPELVRDFRCGNANCAYMMVGERGFSTFLSVFDNVDVDDAGDVEGRRPSTFCGVFPVTLGLRKYVLLGDVFLDLLIQVVTLLLVATLFREV